MEGLDRFLYISDGSGSGSGSGYGDGDGSGYGYGDGSGSGSGSGSGYGYGYGYGSGSGYGDGDGSGSGYGDDLKSFLGMDVHIIDNIKTVITSVKGFIAKGFIIRSDLTTHDCYIARVGNSFAHGDTIKQALNDAEEKHIINSPVEDRIQLFLSSVGDKPIPARDLYDWHFKLTGSCSFGRDEFVRSHGIDINSDSFTVDQFINLTIDAYGGDVIKELKKEYEK